jgi:serine protease Do
MRSLPPEKLGILGAVAAIVLAGLFEWGGDLMQPAPEAFPDRSGYVAPPVRDLPPGRTPRRPLPPPSLYDIKLRIEEREKIGSGVGTAFVVSPDYWLTARHVVEGCDRLGFVVDRQHVVPIKSDAVWHPDADIALVRADAGRSPALTLGPLPDIGDVGYHYGFPGTGKGRVSSALLGRGELHGKSLRGVGRLVLVWAETGREGVAPGSLGGISGGPTLDASGRLVGIAIASNTRRGRVSTVAPRTIQQMLNSGKVPVQEARQAGWAGAPSFSELERTGTVRQLYCKVGS